MINCSTNLYFLKSGNELEKDIHDAIDETIKLIFEHNSTPKSITPSQVTNKNNTQLVFYKFFHNHRQTNHVEFNEDWCKSLFKISNEAQKDYTGQNTIAALLSGFKDQGIPSKALYKSSKSVYRLFFYILWARGAVLLPFYYKPPKARDNEKNKWIEIGLPIYPETLRLVRNIHFQDGKHEDFRKHLDTGLTFVKDYGYNCIIASTCYSIEDIELDDIPPFKEFYSKLVKTNDLYSNKIRSLPFLALLTGYLSYASTRCNFKINELENVCISKPTVKTSDDFFGLEVDDLEFKFEANLTNKLKFILKGDALGFAVEDSLVNTFNDLLRRHLNKNISFGVNDSIDYQHPRTIFIQIFKTVKNLTKNDLVYLYELLEHDYLSKKDILPYLFDNTDQELWTIDYSDHFKSGLKFFFIELHSASAILLPMSFVIPEKLDKNYIENRCPEILKIILNYKNHFKPEDLVGHDNIHILYRAIISSNWRNIEDITLSDAYEYQNMYQQNKTNSPNKLKLDLLDLLILLNKYASTRCNYTLNELSQGLSDLSPGSLLNDKELNKTKNITGKKWILLAKQYLKSREDRGFKSNKEAKAAIGKLIQHICVDLPRDLGEENEFIPTVPNQFKRSHVSGNWRIKGLKEKIEKNVSNQTFNNHLRVISAFFDWILIEFEDSDTDVAGFLNPFSPLDVKITSARKGTNKKAFPRRQFSHVHSFISAICEFYWYLITEDKFVSGAPSSRKIYDTQKIGYVPIVLIAGKLHPIYFIPASLTTEITSMRNGDIYTYPTFQALFEPLIALETGLRHIHIRWLDRDKFDVSLINSSNNYISQLHVYYCDSGESASIEVGTDKVKTEPWNPHVSSRVINLLRRIKAFQYTLDIKVPRLWYDGHEGSIHGKISSLFCSMDATETVTSVISETVCRNQYKRLLCFYDLFIQLSGLDVPLLGVTSVKALKEIHAARTKASEILIKKTNFNEQDFRKMVSEIGTKSAFYYNGQYKTDFKPHGTRASVASEKIKVLPPHAIQEFITGHESNALLSYYIQVDTDWLNEISEYNDEIFLSDTHLQKTRNNNLSEAQKAKTNKKLKKIVEQDPTLLSTNFGAVSFTAETSKNNFESGLKTIAITPVSNLACMPTHICPYGGMCPDEIKLDMGEYKCGQCYFSVKTVDNIPRILAHMRKLNDQLNEKENSIVEADKAGADVEALELMENEKIQIGNELSAWTYTHAILEDNLTQLKDKYSKNPKEFLIARPDILMKSFIKGEVEDNSVNALLLRIQDANAFQEYFTPQLKAQITQLRNKILIKHKHFDQLLQQPDGFDLLDEFRGLLRALTETQGISLSEAAKRLSEPLGQSNAPLKMLEVLNG